MPPFPIGNRFIDGKEYTLSPAFKQRHLFITGKSGTGKSTLLSNMAAWDIYHNLGVTIIDPHGGLIEEVLQRIPRARTNDVIYINPQDQTQVIGINPLESVSPDQRPLIVSSIISIFKKIWGDSWGARTEDILRHTTYALLEQPTPQTLVAIPRLLTDATFRERIIENVTDPEIRHYLTEFGEKNTRLREESISPVLNKVRAFTTNPLLRSVIGQTKSSFNFRWAMDEGKIILCNLSKGALGEDVSSLLGSLIVTKLSLAALSRQDIPEADRRLHVLMCDEISGFIHGVDFPTVLGEARKYKLAIVAATQTLSQLPAPSLAAVLGNCGTFITFRVSGEDAEILQHEFSTNKPVHLLQDLPDFRLYVKTMTEDNQGVPKPTEPDLIHAHPPFDELLHQSSQKIINASLQRYARPRAAIEAELKSVL